MLFRSLNSKNFEARLVDIHTRQKKNINYNLIRSKKKSQTKNQGFFKVMAQTIGCCGSNTTGDNVVEPLGGTKMSKSSKSSDPFKIDLDAKQHQTIEVKTAADLNGNGQPKEQLDSPKDLGGEEENKKNENTIVDGKQITNRELPKDDTLEKERGGSLSVSGNINNIYHTFAIDEKNMSNGAVFDDNVAATDPEFGDLQRATILAIMQTPFDQNDHINENALQAIRYTFASNLPNHSLRVLNTQMDLSNVLFP